MWSGLRFPDYMFYWNAPRSKYINRWLVNPGLREAYKERQDEQIRWHSGLYSRGYIRKASQFTWNEYWRNNLVSNKVQGYRCVVSVIYRTRSSDVSFWNGINRSIERAFEITSSVILFGDFNSDFLKHQHSRAAWVTSWYCLAVQPDKRDSRANKGYRYQCLAYWPHNDISKWYSKDNGHYTGILTFNPCLTDHRRVSV